MAASNVQDQIFSKLKVSLEGQKAQAAFCCGGSSEINDELSRPDIRFKEAPPVILHWATDEQQSIQKISFSQNALKTDELKNQAQRLTDACQPASFGKGGKDVNDESYRKAGKLDSTCFTTTFHPHDYGILQDVQRILLPAFEKGLKSDSTIFVQAELYKLNVYSGPGGKFKAHVDTPRGQDQFGSLVVSLPSAHKGGALAIRHNGREMSFDWSCESPKSIEWVAFFSDCEHEVAELSCGHRVTLTYNLYTTSPSISKPMGSIEVESFPFYWEMKAAMRTKSFLEDGGTIGFFCNHFYAQNYSKSSEVLPQALKGIDMIVHAVSSAVGLASNIRPIMEKPEYYETSDEEDGMHDNDEDENNVSIDDEEEMMTDDEVEDESGYTQRDVVLTDPQRDTDPGLMLNTGTSLAAQQVLLNSPAKEKIRYTHKEGEDVADNPRPSFAALPNHRFEKMERLVGREFKKFKFSPYDMVGEEISAVEFMNKKWPHDRKSVYWITDMRQQEPALAFMAYGNNASIECSYSAAAILVDIPAWSEHRGVF